MEPRNQTWVIRLRNKYFHPLSHTTSPTFDFFKSPAVINTASGNTLHVCICMSGGRSPRSSWKWAHWVILGVVSLTGVTSLYSCYDILLRKPSSPALPMAYCPWHSGLPGCGMTSEGLGPRARDQDV